jgi:hypothetical protein
MSDDMVVAIVFGIIIVTLVAVLIATVQFMPMM